MLKIIKSFEDYMNENSSIIHLKRNIVQSNATKMDSQKISVKMEPHLENLNFLNDLKEEDFYFEVEGDKLDSDVNDDISTEENLKITFNNLSDENIVDLNLIINEYENQGCIFTYSIPYIKLNEENSFNDYPQTAIDNAKKAIDWKEKHSAEMGSINRANLIRAKLLAHEERLSLRNIKTIASLSKDLEVEQRFKKTPWKDNKYMLFMLGGGNSMITWAQNKLKSLNK